MPIFLDTADLAEIERFHRVGLIRGVTTNPTVLLKDGVSEGVRGIQRRAKDIANLIAPLPLAMHIMSDNPDQILYEAQTFASWADNIVINIPIHGPSGRLDHLDSIHALETVYDIRVGVTAMMSAQQCLLAALVGATYVSLFGGRVNNMGYNAITEIGKLRKLLDKFSLKSEIIVAATREVLNVIEWLEAGADLVTVFPGLLEGMVVHPYTRETVQMFLRDSASLRKLLTDEWRVSTRSSVPESYRRAETRIAQGQGQYVKNPERLQLSGLAYRRPDLGGQIDELADLAWIAVVEALKEKVSEPALLGDATADQNPEIDRIKLQLNLLDEFMASARLGGAGTEDWSSTSLLQDARSTLEQLRRDLKPDETKFLVLYDEVVMELSEKDCNQSSLVRLAEACFKNMTSLESAEELTQADSHVTADPIISTSTT